MILSHNDTRDLYPPSPLSPANKAKVLYGIPRDPDMALALAQLEEEESENAAEDDKPKVRF